MAKIFHFTPAEVDNIDFERVLNLLNLDVEWRKKEQEEIKKR
jgi:hypothetical protein